MKGMRQGSFFPSNFVLSNFERASFERMFKVDLHSNERYFLTETNFKRTTDEFWNNFIWSNNLSRLSRQFQKLYKFTQNRFLCSVNFQLTIHSGQTQNKKHKRKEYIFFPFIFFVLSLTRMDCELKVDWA